MDDQRERHLIGDLLSDDEVFAPVQQQNVVKSGPMEGNRVSPAGPVGRPSGTHARYWPEPPPPYTPQANLPWADHIKQQEVLVSGYAGFHRGPPPMPIQDNGYTYMPNHNTTMQHNAQYYQDGPYLGMYPIPVRPHQYAAGLSAPPTPGSSIRGMPYKHMKSQPQLNEPSMLDNTAPFRTQSVGSDCFLIGMPDNREQNPLPKAGLSYRDVAKTNSEKPAGNRVQPKNVVLRKTGICHSSSDSHSEGNGNENMSLGIDPREEESRKLALMLDKEQDSLIMENVAKRNQTTNTYAEFQKIVRRKGRPVLPTKEKENNMKKDTSRFEVLANRVGQMSPGRHVTNQATQLNNESTAPIGRNSKQAYINNDLSNYEDDGRQKKLKQKQRRDSSYRRGSTPLNTFITLINTVCLTIGLYVRAGFTWLVELVTDIAAQTTDLLLFFCRQFVSRICSTCQSGWFKVWSYCRAVCNKLRQVNYSTWYKPFKWKGIFSKKPVSEQMLGLEHNIHLPSSGDEAMQRLLSNRGQDAYSILGLRSDCSDSDIKQYYKRQAVLVHPDKNQATGADEAFRILAQAFELIGTWEARQHYSMEAASGKIREMMQALRKKVQEALSTMHCDCGQKHRRYATNRALSDARYCRKCKEHHPARENDIWAESHYFGILWYYLACMDGAVYDVTEWARCPKNLLKHMKANSHLVQYRLITGKNPGKKRQHRIPNESEIDDFVGNLLSKPGNVGGAVASSASYQPPIAPCGDSRPRKAGRRRKIK